ncbi:MAG: hypothetical protein NUV88_00470 [Candidatus Kaiserbacteria bacterium]|nr:hypothetical protein [Candidatus Kaiserbacteria bacterium]
MTFYEFCDKIDETLHDHATVLIPIFIFIAALAFLAVGYLATHPFPGIDDTNVSQAIEK